MNTRFTKAFEKTLRLEGGLSNDKYDTGGLTKFGISQKVYPKLKIAELTIEDAKAIYLRDYWNANLCDKIQDEKVAIQVFDICVNGGASCIQKAVNSLLPQNSFVKVDGAIGAKTILAINGIKDQATLNNRIAKYRAWRFAEICRRNPTQLGFFEGWIARTFEFI